ncbi:hypothetical protein GN956_G26823 [Arapaima gigas]
MYRRRRRECVSAAQRQVADKETSQPDNEYETIHEKRAERSGKAVVYAEVNHTVPRKKKKKKGGDTCAPTAEYATVRTAP